MKKTEKKPKKIKKELEPTYLIQRLNPPNTKTKLNPFSFGGALKNGGLSDDAFNILSEIFSFEYMGAAEYEFGAIPKSLDNMVNDLDNYVSSSMVINKIEVYFICHNDLVTSVKKRLIELSKNKIITKGHNAFQDALGLSPYFSKEKCRSFGWMELNNDFLFFIDKNAFDCFVKLFEIKAK